jgi:hypothetical protein
MRTKRSQRGFLLNPYRFEGTVQEGALSLVAASMATLRGASIVAAEATVTAGGGLIVETDQAASGAFSATGAAGGMTAAGASIFSATASASGASGLTVYPASQTLICDAAEFDGTNDYITRSGSMSGVSASASGILSVWLYQDLASTITPWHFYDASGSSAVLHAWLDSSGILNPFTVQANAAGGSAASTFLAETDQAITDNQWVHVLVSWNGTDSHIYVNDTEAKDDTDDVNNATNVDWTLVDVWRIGARATDGTFKYTGGMAEFYFAEGQYLDFSVEENRRKFISSGGKPVDLGATGSTPTGTTPTIYLHLDDGESAANFAINRAGKGNFTVTGALATSATSPSD